MRKQASLFPRVRSQILAALLLEPSKEWYASELAARIGTRPSSLQREIARLVGAGIVSERRDGNRLYVRANRQSPVFPELRSLMVKTTGVAEPLRRALSPLAKRIKAAFVFGSVATGTEGAASDVDLLVVGSVGLSEVVKALGPAEQELGRTINPIVTTGMELSQAVKQRKHFLTSVLSGPLVPIIGTESDLERIAGSRSRQ